MRRGADRRVWNLLLALACLGALPAASAMHARDIEVGQFHRVYFSGAATVRLTQGDVTRLAVRGSPEALDRLQVDTRNGALYIDASHSDPELLLELQVADLIQFVSQGDGRITGDDLHFDALLLEGSGAGSFDLRRLEARELEVHGQGTTRFELTGQVANHVVKLSGSGAYQALELISDRVSVNVAGNSDVRLWAENLLDVVVAGAALIRYAGSPRVEQQVSGVARVLRLPGIII